MAVQNRYVRRNLLALSSDFIMFMVGFVFWDPTVVVPVFVKELTGNDLMVGVFAAIRVLTVSLPGLWTASYLLTQPRKKPVLIWASFGGRLPVLLIAVATLLWADRAPWLVVVLLAISVGMFFTSEGMNGVSWPDIIGKVLPSNIRGRFLGTAQLVASVVGLGSGALVRLILGHSAWGASTRWALMFACAFVGFALSWVALASIHEEPDDKIPAPPDLKASLRSMTAYLREDASLRRLVITQLLLASAGSSFPFFSVRARELLPGGDAMLGTFLILQSLGGILAAPLWGYLIDRIGSWLAIRLGAVAHMAAFAGVVAGGLLGVPEPFYLATFFLLGVISSTSWWAFTSYLLDLATPDRRATYLATSSILTSPTILTALAAGVLYKVLGPEWLFGLGLVLDFAAVTLAWTLARSRAGGRQTAM
jgi:MFS family permease